VGEKLKKKGFVKIDGKHINLSEYDMIDDDFDPSLILIV
jgi:hypothetical protein